jgi:hypothetical protein
VKASTAFTALSHPPTRKPPFPLAPAPRPPPLPKGPPGCAEALSRWRACSGPPSESPWLRLPVPCGGTGSGVRRRRGPSCPRGEAAARATYVGNRGLAPAAPTARTPAAGVEQGSPAQAWGGADGTPPSATALVSLPPRGSSTAMSPRNRRGLTCSRSRRRRKQ